MEDYVWKPIMIVLAIFMVVLLLLDAMPRAFPDVQWSNINITLIALLPWILALGLGLFILAYISGKK